eukprot:g39320.t1
MVEDDALDAEFDGVGLFPHGRDSMKVEELGVRDRILAGRFDGEVQVGAERAEDCVFREGRGWSRRESDSGVSSSGGNDIRNDVGRSDIVDAISGRGQGNHMVVAQGKLRSIGDDPAAYASTEKGNACKNKLEHHPGGQVTNADALNCLLLLEALLVVPPLEES